MYFFCILCVLYNRAFWSSFEKRLYHIGVVSHLDENLQGNQIVLKFNIRTKIMNDFTKKLTTFIIDCKFKTVQLSETIAQYWIWMLKSTPVINFTNILQATFVPIFLRQKVFPFRLTELFLFWPYYTEGYDKSINCENFDL